MNVNKTDIHNLIILVLVGLQGCTAYHLYYSKFLCSIIKQLLTFMEAI